MANDSDTCGLHNAHGRKSARNKFATTLLPAAVSLLQPPWYLRS